MRHSNTAIQENPMCNSIRAKAHCPSRMGFLKASALSMLLLIAIVLPSACRRTQSNVFVVALSDNIKTIDPICSPAVDPASQPPRALIFNLLVDQHQELDHVPELAAN